MQNTHSTLPILSKKNLLIPIIITSAFLSACQPTTKSDEKIEVQLTPITPETSTGNRKSTQVEVIQSKSESKKTENSQPETKKTNAESLTNIPQTTTTGDAETQKPLSKKKPLSNPQNQAMKNPPNNLPNISSGNSSGKLLKNPPPNLSINPHQNQANNQIENPEYQQSGPPSLRSNQVQQDRQNKQVPQDTQITNVSYHNTAGETLKATFETASIGDLKVKMVMPDGYKIVLTAPQAGGNNPIYESTDGSVVLVSHSGGGSVDLVINGQAIEFDAISANAEVVTDRDTDLQ